VVDQGFDGVVFDCDGVLIDSEPIANAVLADSLAEEIGYRITAEESHCRFTGMIFGQIEDQLRTETGVSFPDGWVGRHFETLFARYRTELKAMDGVHDLVEALDGRGIPWGVASQSPPDYLELVLDLIGLGERARGRVASAKEVALPKPAPDVYLVACERISRDPSRVAVIEDSPTGARAGVAAGCTVFGYVHDRPAEELMQAGCTTTVSRLADLRDRLLGG